jgi:hypothetical protein
LRRRKVLADIAMHEAEAFSAIIAQAKGALEKPVPSNVEGKAA